MIQAHPEILRSAAMPSSRTRDSRTGERQWFGSPDARWLLQEHRLHHLDALFDRGRNAACRHTGRAVYDETVTDSSGRSVRLFIKLQEGRRRLWPRMNDLRTGQVFQSLAMREWQGIERLNRLGIRVPERLGVFESSRWSLWFRAAVVVREVPAPQSIDEMLSNGDWQRLAFEDQDRILDLVVSTLDRIHSQGLGWRGSSSRHFFPERDANGRWQVWLIDCEGVHRFASRKIRDRNFQKLIRAFRESGADAGTLARLEQRIAERPSAAGHRLLLRRSA